MLAFAVPELASVKRVPVFDEAPVPSDREIFARLPVKLAAAEDETSKTFPEVKDEEESANAVAVVTELNVNDVVKAP